MRSALSALAVSLAVGLTFSPLARAADAASPSDRFVAQALRPAVQSGLQDAEVAALPQELAAAKEAQPGDWSSADIALNSIQKFHDHFAAARQAFESQGTPPAAADLDSLRSELRDVFTWTDVADKDHTLETTYLAQLAPLAAVDPRVAGDVQKRMEAVESKLPPGRRAEYRESIDKFSSAVKSGDWQSASKNFASLYDKLKTGGGDVKAALGQANVVARTMKRRPARSAAEFTANKSRFEGGLKINGNVPIPYSPEDVQKLAAADSGRKLGLATMAAGGGITAWTGAGLAGLATVPPALVIVLGIGLVVGGYVLYGAAKNSARAVRQRPPSETEDELRDE